MYGSIYIYIFFLIILIFKYKIKKKKKKKKKKIENSAVILFIASMYIILLQPIKQLKKINQTQTLYTK